MYDTVPACGQMRGSVFVLPVRVYYEDTDAGGIVYYANYLKFAERARTEFIRSLGCRQQDGLEADEACGFAVKHLEIEYHRPAVLDDALEVTCRVTEIKGASAVMHQEIWRGDELLVSLDVRVAYLSLKKKRPVRIPENLVSEIQKNM